ncbi:putative tRNA modification GTPase [Quillaja saponaria]|uniref:tRNA modification GTPase n=1 Tax=Quillaja saponaria TaxID=32244 RepID=A0AAD7PL28_QUISA|nr:putative tRNA modification GTPase [Quillaja saponaria]
MSACWNQLVQCRECEHNCGHIDLHWRSPAAVGIVRLWGHPVLPRWLLLVPVKKKKKSSGFSSTQCWLRDPALAKMWLNFNAMGVKCVCSYAVNLFGSWSKTCRSREHVFTSSFTGQGLQELEREILELVGLDRIPAGVADGLSIRRELTREEIKEKEKRKKAKQKEEERKEEERKAKEKEKRKREDKEKKREAEEELRRKEEKEKKKRQELKRKEKEKKEKLKHKRKK